MKKLIFAAAISLLLCAGGAALWAHVSSDEFLDANAEALNEADVVVTDPPRKGCGESLIRRMTDCGAKRIVYISCNPDTLARDCRLFEEFGYRYGKVYLFDLFPRTGHVEAVVCLEKSEVQG